MTTFDRWVPWLFQFADSVGKVTLNTTPLNLLAFDLPPLGAGSIDTGV